MANVRVFELANELGLDVNTVIAFMNSLGAYGEATSSLSPLVERRLRTALLGVKSGDRPTTKATRRKATPPPAQPRAAAARPGATRQPNPRERHNAAVLAAIPGMYAMLRDSGVPTTDSPVVVFHDPSAPRSARYGVRTIADMTWRPGAQFPSQPAEEFRGKRHGMRDT